MLAGNNMSDPNIKASKRERRKQMEEDRLKGRWEIFLRKETSLCAKTNRKLSRAVSL